MSKGLEALKEIKSTWNCMNPNSSSAKETHFDIIKTALKRLEKIDNPKIVGTITVDKALEQFLIKHCPDVEKKLKALEIIKETPIFAWYVTIYKNAYEMVADAKGFKTNKSVEELQEEFDLLKEMLK